MIYERAIKKAEKSWNVFRARDGVEALDFLRCEDAAEGRSNPFLILLDINMPRMNGHEFLQAVRADSDIANARVVVMTTSEDPTDIARAYENHAVGYIVKPAGTTETSKVLSVLHEYFRLCKFPFINALPLTK